MNKVASTPARSNEGFLFYNTVQTSWRPQLPLPKEVANVENNSTGMDKNTKKDSTSKKWSFGRFFRRKKEIESESSSEEDRKAGFSPQKLRNKKDKPKRGSKTIGFDHIVVSPKEELFLPFETIDPYDVQNRSTNSIEKRGRRDRKKSARVAQCQSSSDDELVSINSSSVSRYRSDESLGSGGVAGTNKKSRTARNERYLKRMNRDDTGSSPMVEVSHQVGRWKTQPVQVTNNYSSSYQNEQPHRGYTLKSSSSLTHMPNVAQSQKSWAPVPPAPPAPPIYSKPNKPKLQNGVSSEKRSISFDNHIHLQNRYPPTNNVKNEPPPPPPRDPQRRVNMNQGELRPISYAFDQNHCPTFAISGRCVSDDKLWGPNGSVYQSNVPQPRPSSTQPTTQPLRYVTRTPQEQFASSFPKTAPFGNDYKYIADAVPRSRKPIHVINQDEPKKPQIPTASSAFISPAIIRTTKSGLPSSPSPVQSASEFWKRMDQAQSTRRGRDMERGPKSRSFSSSRIGESNNYRNPGFDNIYQNYTFQRKNTNLSKNPSQDELDNVVQGSLFIKPTKDNEKVQIQVMTNTTSNKSSSMPNYYQQKMSNKNILTTKPTTPPPLNKYDEYVAKKSAIIIDSNKPKIPPAPPQRKSIKLNADEDFTEKLRKSTNLEDAINELEAIYKSLKLGDEDLMDRAERRDIPTPTNFEKYATLNNDEYNDDDDEETGEPDVVLDDVVYRNLKRANNVLKVAEPQPPFGIPIVPVPASPNTDYLHVTPEKENKKNRCVPQNYPDLVSDDMAVRSLRKEPPGVDKPSYVYPASSTNKKKRATRTQSANIYTLIQRDAAKPSGGNLYDYYDIDKPLGKAGSMSDVRKDIDDVPSTLFLIRSIQNEDQKQKQMQQCFRHPSQVGAVFNLPSTLNKTIISDNYPTISAASSKTPVPLPRKSLSPDPQRRKSGMEEVLNKIAKEAKESSEKLGRDLQELRKEAISKSSSPGSENLSTQNLKFEEEIKAIDEVSDAARRYEEMLLDVIPPITEAEPVSIKPRKLKTEEKLLNDITKVSEAAKACEKLLLQEVLTSEPPPIVQIAQIVKNNSRASESTDKSSDDVSMVASLFEKLDPNSNKIGEIAARCMRQISELGDLKDEVVTEYDNLPSTSVSAAACKNPEHDYANTSSDSVIVPGRSIEDDLEKLSNNGGNTTKVSTDDNRTSDEAIGGFSSSDCLKSSSPTSSHHKSSSVTSIHAFSSSDYVKSTTSSDLNNTPSTDQIKTFSTTSYDVKSSSFSPQVTNSPFSTTPSPPLDLTPVGNGTGSPSSQYNSSEELAMIFGIRRSTSPATTTASTATPATGNTLAIASTCKNVENNTSTNKLANINNENYDLIKCHSSSNTSYYYHHQNNYKNSFKHACDVFSVANFNTPEFSRNIKLVTLNTSSLETIPELHDDDDDNYDDDFDSDNNINSYTTSCMIDKSDNNSFNSFTNNINIIISNSDDNTNSNIDTQLDSFSSIDSDSNPDSGNVSLSDFPVQQQINTNIELSLLHNSKYQCSNNQYTFINQIEISTTTSCDDDGDDDILPESDDDDDDDTIDNIDNINISAVNSDDDKVQSDLTNIAQNSFNNANLINNNSCVPDCSNGKQNNELKHRITLDDAERSSISCIPSTSSANTTNNVKSLMLPENRQTFFQHIVIACTYGIASNDVFTLLVIIIAIITLITLLIF